MSNHERTINKRIRINRMINLPIINCLRPTGTTKMVFNVFSVYSLLIRNTATTAITRGPNNSIRNIMVSS
jgi:hypothetical protein